ncbi:MAG: right-handed parallel beta-helix repeat-containing protein [Candidatus Micrarchaeota archaeon]
MSGKSISVFLSIILLSSLSFATLAVNGTGDSCVPGATANYSTIQAAINAASAGDTIIVCQNGSSGYNETVRVNKMINLYGNGTGVEVFGNTDSDTVFTINVSSVNMSNFTISGATGASSIQLTNTSGNCTLTDILAYDMYYGFVIEGNNNIISNNTIYNGTNNNHFLFTSSSNNIVTNNTAYNCENECFRLDDSSNNNTLTFNTAYNSDNSAFQISSTCTNNTLISNTAYNTVGFIIMTNNITLTNNTAYNTSVGFLLFNSTDTYLYNNTVHNTTIGFYVAYDSTITTFEGNNVTNATQYALLISDNFIGLYGSSSLTFSGNNGIYNTPSTGKEIYLYNSSISTNGYNITTSNFSFGLNTSYNVSIQTIDFDAAGYTTISSVNGASASGKILQNHNGNYYWFNVTNTSVSSNFSAIYYYNGSDFDSYSEASLGLGSTLAGSSWTYSSPTALYTDLDKMEASANMTVTTLYAPLVYTAASEEEETQSDNQNSKTKVLKITHKFTCPILEVTASEDALVKLTLYEPYGGVLQTKNTVDGIAEFNMSGMYEGIYRINAYKSNYVPHEIEFEFNCVEEQINEPEVEPEDVVDEVLPEEPPVEQPEEQPVTPPVQPDVTDDDTNDDSSNNEITPPEILPDTSIVPPPAPSIEPKTDLTPLILVGALGGLGLLAGFGAGLFFRK